MISKRLMAILVRKDKRRFLGLVVAILVLGLLELLGIASVLPFMELLSKPDSIEKSSFLTKVFVLFDFSSHRSFLIFTGLFVIGVIALANLFAILTTYLQFKFSWDISHDMTARLLRTYLHKPYSYYLGQNTSTLRSYLLSEVSTLTSGILDPILEFISRSFICFIIFSLLVVLDPTIAISMLLLLGGAYLVIYISRQKLLKRLGNERMQSNIDRYRYLEEMLTGIKTLKIYGVNEHFYDRFEGASRAFCDIQPKVKMVYAAPKYLLEILAFGGILAVTLYLYITTSEIEKILPRLTLYAVAGYRLLPALQSAFASASRIKHSLPVLDKLFDDLVASLKQLPFLDPLETKMPFKKAITLDSVEFDYENGDQKVLNKISLQIEKGSVVAFVGSTGSGKTTLTDLITGLLIPSQGQILIDKQPLNDSNVTSWQGNIGYVPQDVFMFDDTIQANIAIGIESKKVDVKRLRWCSETAKIHDWIVKELPEGFATQIGERGVRLSGGQRQRIGLARALYTNPNVLILDEATSALDSLTEQAIIESIKELAQDLTIIIVAHRLSTVRYADNIFMLEDGNFIDCGNYDELIEKSEKFRKMALLSQQ